MELEDFFNDIIDWLWEPDWCWHRSTEHMSDFCMHSNKMYITKWSLILFSKWFAKNSTSNGGETEMKERMWVSKPHCWNRNSNWASIEHGVLHVQLLMYYRSSCLPPQCPAFSYFSSHSYYSSSRWTTSWENTHYHFAVSMKKHYISRTV